MKLYALSDNYRPAVKLVYSDDAEFLDELNAHEPVPFQIIAGPVEVANKAKLTASLDALFEKKNDSWYSASHNEIRAIFSLADVFGLQSPSVEVARVNEVEIFEVRKRAQPTNLYDIGLKICDMIEYNSRSENNPAKKKRIATVLNATKVIYQNEEYSLSALAVKFWNEDNTVKRTSANGMHHFSHNGIFLSDMRWLSDESYGINARDRVIPVLKKRYAGQTLPNGIKV